MIQLHLGDCLNVMGEIPDGSIDLICADLPYGTTACKWDVVIPFESLWKHYRRLLKPRGAVVLTASQPFTSMLVMSNREWFRHETTWQKTRPSGFMHCNKSPLKSHENILVFSGGAFTYNPQMQQAERRVEGLRRIKADPTSCRSERLRRFDNGGMAYPRSVVTFANPNHDNFHPTQKPVALMEYLIKTYSNEGETVLDNTMGSGTTGIACINTNRNFTGIEKDETYFGVAKSRIDKHIKDQAFLLPLS